MKVLVTYASRHGATKGIAERIAAALGEAGFSAEVKPVDQVRSLDPHDAFVVGSAAYMFHWFREFDELSALIQTRGERVFFGAWDPDAPPVGLGERLLRLMPAAREATPAGDFRDWAAIDAWATEIASHLETMENASR